MMSASPAVARPDVKAVGHKRLDFKLRDWRVRRNLDGAPPRAQADGSPRRGGRLADVEHEENDDESDMRAFHESLQQLLKFLEILKSSAQIFVVAQFFSRSPR